MVTCDGCSTEHENKENLHEHQEGGECCTECAMYCSNCNKWFDPENIRECNGDFLCIDCVKKQLQI